MRFYLLLTVTLLLASFTAADVGLRQAMRRDASGHCTAHCWECGNHNMCCCHKEKCVNGRCTK
uniref:Conotoxin n=1 Tax=Conus praecellens TaxID=128530 RepID=A0A291C2V4_CONPC|nr:conotoxin [Conus praecellens]